MDKILSCLVLFAEPEFPVMDVPEPIRIDGAIVTRSVAELRAALKPGRVLVWRHGSAFPATAWDDISHFLDAGGSLLYLGGEPFTRPVIGNPGSRHVQPRNLAILKSLRLNQCYRLAVPRSELWLLGVPSRGPIREMPSPITVAVLEPRLTDTKDFPDEEGSPGSRDAIVRPLVLVQDPDGDRNAPIAAGAIAIDRIRGRWAGGRWVFWLVSKPPDQQELAALISAAVASPAEFRVDPTFGCFHAGERPSVMIRLDEPRPRGEGPRSVALEVTLPDGERKTLPAVRLEAGAHVSASVALEVGERPGLYQVEGRCQGLPTAYTGFWIFDAELFASGDALTLDHDTLRRNNVPEPIVGTTMMSATVHRHFLFEPNAAVWDATFAEMARTHINLVRTGVWSGWSRICPGPGVVDEAWMRALEAYYLSARKHGIPVIFNFFAFLPPTFGGANPFLSPRALEGQRALLAAVARRFAPAKEMMWDLINEPSFSSARHLWMCRPSGDADERRAFHEWLRARFGGEDGTGRAGPLAGPSRTRPEGWADVVRARWRLGPTDAIELPGEEDFGDRWTFEHRRPYRAMDYVLFSQDMFGRWTDEMSAAIRGAGSKTPITVGQDEGGLTARPGPLYHHDRVQFTSMHTWWTNDALLWDGLMSKAAGTPLLISETGIMQRELLSGEAIRSPDDFARLLSRKIGYAFACGAFGVVQWCYEVNPYMASDNEVAIGLRRVDGSCKPEMTVMREFADFVHRNRERFEAPRPPDVVLIVPSGDQFSPRDDATAATRRAVDVLCREMGLRIRIVPDSRAPRDLGKPRAIILPACRGVCEAGWQAIVSAARAGAVVMCSGWFEADDAGLPARRLGLGRRPLFQAEPAAPAVASEPAGRMRDAAVIRFPAMITQSCFAAASDGGAGLVTVDGVRIHHHPLPVEWAEGTSAMRTLYESGLADAHVALSPAARAAGAAGVLLTRIEFKNATLVIAVSESSRAYDVDLGKAGALHVPAGVARMAFVDKSGTKVLDRSHS